jgi:hypothetical protein
MGKMGTKELSCLREETPNLELRNGDVCKHTPTGRGKADPKLTQAGDCHLAEARLGLFGQARKDHRDVITDVLIPSAGNNNAIAMNLPAIAWRLKGE